MKYLILTFLFVLTSCNIDRQTNISKWQPIADLPTPAAQNNEATLLTINRVHSTIKRDFKYIPDGVDHWDTPAEFVKRGGGDCEDFAIYMAFELMKHGFRREDMQLLVGQQFTGEIHATLQVRDENDNKIIDDARFFLPVPKSDYVKDFGWKTLETYQF